MALSTSLPLHTGVTGSLHPAWVRFLHCSCSMHQLLPRVGCSRECNPVSPCPILHQFVLSSCFAQPFCVLSFPWSDMPSGSLSQGALTSAAWQKHRSHSLPHPWLLQTAPAPHPSHCIPSPAVVGWPREGEMQTPHCLETSPVLETAASPPHCCVPVQQCHHCLPPKVPFPMLGHLLSTQTGAALREAGMG